MNFDNLLFPHSKVRDIQEDLILKIDDVVSKGKNLIAHAPTGLGKTAAALAPVLKYALEHDKVVFFLTSRHTQHKIAVDTLKSIRDKFDKKFGGVSIIGKKGLCLQPGVNKLYSSEFHEYCRAMREDKKCEFFNNLKNKDKLSGSARSALSDLKVLNPITTDDSLEVSERYSVCPYEISLLMAKDAKVIIGDYYYIFHPDISANLFKKIDKSLSDSIIVVDEAHNLPGRVKDLFSARLSNIMVRRAVSEAKKFKFDQLRHLLIQIGDLIDELCNFDVEEQYISKELFIDKINEFCDYQELIEDLSFAADAVREEQKQSYIGSVASFLESWLGVNEGFTRIISKQQSTHDEVKVVSYRCLDPSLSTKSVIEAAYSTILMSGTLNPTSMYKELLGFDDSEEETYGSPFPEDNRLNMIIPKTSTKYELRSQDQYKNIADILARIINLVPGNSAVFFPSYYLRDQVYKLFNDLCKKTIFVERANLSKHDKHDLLDRFKGYKDSGAVLLGVISGSFGEGIDLPGDFLKNVVIVGLPLSKTDLEIRALIDYYDKKFGKGWDYGYLFPAFNKALQSAGRCIRSEKDKGTIIFLDERYAWSNYRRCFPSSWNIKTTMLYERMIEDFFSKN
ncbi:MAG: ATP-dependent DNA helicase [Nanoarchaeota archaeon]|nr:ATP-dependent DNA helicase [Nanoarchaeota archaeon]